MSTTPQQQMVLNKLKGQKRVASRSTKAAQKQFTRASGSRWQNQKKNSKEQIVPPILQENTF
jgi:hypothetical protein